MSFLSRLFGPPDVDKLVEKIDVRGLVKALNYEEDANVRKAAARALGKIGDPATAPALIEALNDSDRWVCFYAAAALGKMGDPAGLPTLIEALGQNKRRRTAATETLANIGTPAVPALIQALGDSNQHVVIGALAALEKIGEPAVPVLIQALGENDKEVRSGVVAALNDIGDRTAVPALIEALKDSHRYVRLGAGQALTKLGWEPSLDEAGARYWIEQEKWDECVNIGTPAVVPLIKTLIDDDWDVRSHVAEALGKIGDLAAVPPLIEVLEDGDEEIRSRVAEALGKIGDPAAVQPLLEALGDKNEDVRRSLVVALGKIGDPGAVPALIEALGDNNRDVRSCAAEALGKIGDAAAVPALIEALGDDKWVVCSSAAKALGKLGWEPSMDEAGAIYWFEQGEWDKVVEIGLPAVAILIFALKESWRDSEWPVRQRVERALVKVGTPAIPALIEVLTTEDATHPQRTAAKTLGKIGDPAAIPALIEALADKGWRVRSSAAKELGNFGDPVAVPALIEVLTDSKDRISVREKAAEALVKIGDPVAIPALIETLGDFHQKVRRSAAEALGTIGSPEAIEPLKELLRDEYPGVRRAAQNALEEIKKRQETATQALPTRDRETDAEAETAGELADTVTAALDSLDSILEPPVGKGATVEEEQVYVKNVSVKERGKGIVGFWIPEAVDAKNRLRIFQSFTLIDPPASYRVAANQADERGGYFLMFGKARAPGETDAQYQKAMDADRSFAKGTVAAQRGDFQQALRHFEEATKGQPYSPEAWNNKAFALANLNRTREAITCCDNAIELKPGYADPWDIKGRCLGRLGKYKEAIPVIERYIELAPDDRVHQPRVRQAKRAVQNLRARFGG